MLLPVLAGFLMSFQQAMNGTAAVHYGTPIAATLMNFIAGSVMLWAAWLVKTAVTGPGNPLPGEWWYYLGGPLGCVFIGVGALLVRSLGVLVTGLGMIAGQLLGSLGLDLVSPPRHRGGAAHRPRNPADPRRDRAREPALAEGGAEAVTPKRRAGAGRPVG